MQITNKSSKDSFLPLISVVIVTWNRRDEVMKTIQSVIDQDYSHYEIIIVDNGSEDNTVEALQLHYPQVKVIRLEENLGASGGRNPGIKAANGDILFLLDSDASLETRTLANIIDQFEKNKEISILSCKVLYEASREIDPNAWLFTEPDLADQDLQFYSYSFSECAAAIHRSVFEKTGYFWDYLFYGREGEEFALRAWDADFTIQYFPQAVVLHRVSSEGRILTDKQLYYDLRNSLSIYITRYPLWLIMIIAPLKIATSLVKGIRYKNMKPIMSALWNVIMNLAFLLRERHPISNKTARRYIQIQRQHGRFRWTIGSWLKYNRYKLSNHK